MTREEALKAATVFARNACDAAENAYNLAEENGDVEACNAAEQALHDADADYEAELIRIDDEYPL